MMPGSQPAPLSIAVIGTGAIGGFYGGLLARAGHRVQFLARSDYAALRDHGLTLELGDETRRFPVEVFRETAPMAVPEYLLLTGKATANDIFAKQIQPLVGPNTTLVCLQNGMGPTDFFADAFGKEKIIGGLCFVCVNRIAPGVVRNLLRGKVELAEAFGPPSDRLARLVEAFAGAGIPCRAFPSLEQIQWKKLCWNIPFNGLAIAAGGLDTARILASPPLVRLARTLMEEVRAASAARGFPLEEAFLDLQFSQTETMGPYRPSSLIDFQEGRPVEVEAIWGEPLRRGQLAGVAMPALQTLTELIRHLTGDEQTGKPSTAG